MLKLNGGLGTGMGLEKAKSLLTLRDRMTFLDFIAKQATLQPYVAQAVTLCGPACNHMCPSLQPYVDSLQPYVAHVAQAATPCSPRLHRQAG